MIHIQKTNISYLEYLEERIAHFVCEWLHLVSIVHFKDPISKHEGTAGGSGVKSPLPMQELEQRQVWYLLQEDPLEQELSTPFTMPDRKIPMERRAWWATVHGVTQSRTQLRSWAHFQIQSDSEQVVLGPWHEFWGDMIQPKPGSHW